MTMYIQENPPRHPFSDQEDATVLRLKLTGPGKCQVDRQWLDLDLCSRGGHSIREGSG